MKLFFITFALARSRWSHAVACTSLVNRDPRKWRTSPAPDPNEVIWQNLGLRLWERSARKATLTISFLLLLVLYIFPVSAIQGLLQVSAISLCAYLHQLLKPVCTEDVEPHWRHLEWEIKWKSHHTQLGQKKVKATKYFNRWQQQGTSWLHKTKPDNCTRRRWHNNQAYLSIELMALQSWLVIATSFWLRLGHVLIQFYWSLPGGANQLKNAVQQFEAISTILHL